MGTSNKRMRGTPLRKFGPYQVRQTRRGATPTWGVFDTRTRTHLVYSECRESADLVAARLATGRPVETPREALDRDLRLYPCVYPSRFHYYAHRYLCGGNGIVWLQGGLCSWDVSALSPVGERRELDAKLRDEARFEALVQSLATRHGESAGCLARVGRAACDAGTWPEVDADRTLDALHEDSEEFCRLGELVAANFPVDPAWLDDARRALRLLLAEGRNPPHADSRGILRAWAERLAARYGDDWRPDRPAAE